MLKKLISITSILILFLNPLISFADTSYSGANSLTGSTQPIFHKYLNDAYTDFLNKAKEGDNMSQKKRDYESELIVKRTKFVINLAGAYNTEQAYNDAVTFLQTKSDIKSKEFLNFLQSNEWFFKIVLAGIKNKEYNNPVRNPLNNQGQFQLYKFEGYLKQGSCGDDTNLYNSCSVAMNLYKAQKLLTANDNLLQYLDFIGFAKGKFNGFDSYYQTSNIGKSQWHVYSQTEILFKLLGFKYSSDQLINLISNYNFRQRTINITPAITELYNSNINKFNSIGITSINDVKYIPEITFRDSLGTLYNGTGNAGNVRNYGKFVYDNGYPNNNEKLGYQFYQVNCDGCSSVNLVGGYGSTVFSLIVASDDMGYNVHTNIIRFIKPYLTKIKK